MKVITADNDAHYEELCKQHEADFPHTIIIEPAVARVIEGMAEVTGRTYQEVLDDYVNGVIKLLIELRGDDPGRQLN